jgi:hypothetical protein
MKSNLLGLGALFSFISRSYYKAPSEARKLTVSEYKTKRAKEKAARKARSKMHAQRRGR